LSDIIYMLVHLSVENYALIQKLEINFSNGFSVITGETGAGKSILIGALSLILGQRADTTVLNDKSKKCIVEGTFNIGDYSLDTFFKEHDLDFDKHTILRREINPQGRSRAFVNDSPVTLQVLKRLATKLVDIHSQYQTITINDTNFQLAIIDNYAGISAKVEDFGLKYREYIQLERSLEKLIEIEKKAKADKDYYEFQFNELDQAQLIDGEQEDIERELEILNNAEEIKTNLYQVSNILQKEDDNLLGKLSDIKSVVSRLSKYHFKLSELNKRLESSIIEIKDIATEIEMLEDQISYDPGKIEELTGKLDVIYRLQHKHRVGSIDELLAIRNDISVKLNEIGSLDDRISDLENKIDLRKKQLIADAEEISSKRSNVLNQIENDLIKLLSELAMPDSQFKILIHRAEKLSDDGFDKVRFLFNANLGEEMMEIGRIASGGERSRLMLGIKSLVSRKNLLPTIIFDEIDMGISGDTSAKVGNILKKMGDVMQVIVITHLPQIASKSRMHYLVYKENIKNRTFSNIKELAEKERTNEIAKMISDERVTESAMKTAAELLNRNS